eukprot:6999673-Prymnesium_polylepis.1
MSVILEDDTPPPPTILLEVDTKDDDMVIELQPTRPTHARSQHRVPRPHSLSGRTNHEDSGSPPSSAKQFGPDHT